jgi:hypothetical protein
LELADDCIEGSVILADAWLLRTSGMAASTARPALAPVICSESIVLRKGAT